MKRFAAYGSLKKGFHNHNRFGEMKLIGNSTYSGVMFLVHGDYPILFPGAEFPPSLTTEHELEIYEVDDDHYAKIRSMELASGYYEDKIRWNDEDVVIFLGDDNQLDHYRDNQRTYITGYALDVLFGG